MKRTLETSAGSGYAAGWAIGLTWLVITLVVVWWAARLRGAVRAQIVDRGGEILGAVARAQVDSGDAVDAFDADPFIRFVSFPSREGILAARLFDAEGHFTASIPHSVREDAIPAEAWDALRRLEPVSRFRPAVPLRDVFLSTNAMEVSAMADALPLMEVFVPLPEADGRTLGAVAGFVLDGEGVAREFARFDAELMRQAVVVLVLALGVTGAALTWAFRRLAWVNRLLARRTGDLQRANRELSQSARVAALGAVTAHLLHGLKSPVSGLHSFVASRAEGGDPGPESDAWGDALVAARRMQGLVQQVVRVLQDQQAELRYEVTLREIAEAVVQRTAPLARRREVRLELAGDPPAPVDNRAASLLILALANLVENAIEATPAGGRVGVTLSGEDPLAAEVADDGPGLPAAVREHLFEPQRSTKEGGSGIGLAITRQLVLALGGSIGVVRSGEPGTVFRVELPRAGSMMTSAADSADEHA